MIAFNVDFKVLSAMAVNETDKKWTEWLIFLLELNLRSLIVENITSESLFVTFAYLRGPRCH